MMHNANLGNVARQHNSLEAGSVAYSPIVAAALSGATLDQLRHWRRPRTGPLLAPEISAESRIIYSFRDLVALRTFVHLRENASLQRIRKAVGTLRDLGELGHLANYSLLAERSGNIRLLTTDSAEIELARHPGQALLPMWEVIESFQVRAGVVIPDLYKPRTHVSVDPETQAGFPVIAGTRVPYDAVASLMRDVSPKNISDYYPDVSADAAWDAFDFAAYVDSYSPGPRAA
jgi:uncharacterized protein (DUF433 family)/DNA-binding transcriptional MerR regulator